MNHFVETPEALHFVLTTVFSFLVGLEIKAYRQRFHPNTSIHFFGTARTLTFVGILGYLFFRVDPVHFIPYTAGMLGLTGLYMLFYHQKLIDHKQSILLYLVMLCVYTFGPLVHLFPLWMPSLLFVMIVFILNAKTTIQRISLGINPYEFETLGKMVLLSAVILPLLPDRNVIPYIPLSPFKIWLAVVVISAISYGSYLAQKYFFPSRGYFLTGIIGGAYSSTATTVALARKAAQQGGGLVIDAAIVAATAVMYVRLIVVAFVFNQEVARALFMPFFSFFLVGMAIAILTLRRGGPPSSSDTFVDKNPLELGTAFVFAFLFVMMIMLTQYVTVSFGNEGLKFLSFAAGLTDIDPFVLSILTGKYTITHKEIVGAVMIAAGSNDLLKALYALWFGGFKQRFISAVWVGLLGVATIGWGVIWAY